MFPNCSQFFGARKSSCLGKGVCLMATNERTAERNLPATVPCGTVGACTADDKAALFELYRAVYPTASVADLMTDVREVDAASWATYRDERGEIRVALF